MTPDEMDCNNSPADAMDESQISKDEAVVIEKDKANTRLMQLHHLDIFEYNPRPINCLAYDPLSKKIAIARFDGEGSYVEIWNTKGTWYLERTLPVQPSVEAMVWHKSRLFTAGLAGDLVEFDVHSGTIKNKVTNIFGPLWCLAVNKKENLIAAGAEDGSVLFYEVLESEVVFKNVMAMEGKVYSICWHEELNLIITGGSEVRVWDVRTSSLVQKISASVNRDTKVWSVAVCQDFTIISGDSVGQTTFWFGKPGHLSHSKKFQTHEADVHSIAINEEGNKICVAGIDGMVTLMASKEALCEMEGSEMTLDPRLEEKSWVLGKKLSCHAGDVKAVTFIDSSTVVTAGFDCQMIICDLLKKKLKKVSYVRQKDLVHSARRAKCLLLQHPRSVELWRIGSHSHTEGQNGKFLDLEVPEMRLLRINSASDILSSCVSTSARFLAFSNESRISAYRIKITLDSDDRPEVTATPLNFPKAIAHSPASHLSVSPNCNVLVCTTNKQKLVFFDVPTNQRSDGELKVLSKCKLPVDSVIQAMSFNCNSTRLALACSNHGVKIFDVKSAEVACTLPKRESPVYSIDFHPIHMDKLLLSYMDAMIAEISIDGLCYTKKSQTWSNKWHQTFMSQFSQISSTSKFRVFYDPSLRGRSSQKFGDEKVICQHDRGFSVIEWNENLNRSQKRKQDEDSIVRPKVIKFKQTKVLFHVDILAEDTMVVVERSYYDLMATFAPTFKKHKYGT